MDDDRQQRQVAPQGYQGQGQGQRGSFQTPNRYSGLSGADRFRQQPLPSQSVGSVSSGGTGGNLQGYHYGYGEGGQYAGSSMQGAALQYPTEYAQDPQRQQQYAQYGANILYNVAQAQQHGTQQSPYDAVSQYQPRQHAGLDVLPNQFGVAQQYFVEGSLTNASAPPLTAQQNPSQYPPMPYAQQQPASRQNLGSAFIPGINDPSQGTPHGSMVAQEYAPQEQQNYEDHYRAYHNHVRQINQHAHDGKLAEGAQLLLEISEWLLGNVERLALHQDDESVHKHRLSMWDEFNNCWLAVLERQKIMTREMLNTGQPPQEPQSLIDYDFMERMGRDLVRLCDNIEKHGLVDYQMGVAEEDIIEALTTCLDLLEPPAQANAPAAAPASAAPPRRR